MRGRRFINLLSPLGVARAPAYNPVTALGSDLIAYWDAIRADLITQSAGSVSQWLDIVAGYPAVQGTGSAQPIYSATGFNGAPNISYDGIDDQMRANSAALLTALGAVVGTTGSEIWALVSQDVAGATAGSNYIGGYGGSSQATGRNVGRASVTSVNRTLIHCGNGTTGMTAPGTTQDFTGRHVVRGIYAAASSSFTLDGTLDPTLSVVPATQANQLRMGVRSDGSAFIQAGIPVFIVTKALSSDKAAALQAYLNSRRML